MGRIVKRGEIWLVDFGERFGNEVGKLRPALIMQNDVLIEAGHPTVYVMPLSTQERPGADILRVRIEKQKELRKTSYALTDQIRAVEISRLKKGPLATLHADAMTEITACMQMLCSD